jgi:hypothetical protein
VRKQAVKNNTRLLGLRTKQDVQQSKQEPGGKTSQGVFTGYCFLSHLHRKREKTLIRVRTDAQKGEDIDSCSYRSARGGRQRFVFL